MTVDQLIPGEWYKVDSTVCTVYAFQYSHHDGEKIYSFNRIILYEDGEILYPDCGFIYTNCEISSFNQEDRARIL
jgi:hypothetical protein